MNNIKLLILGDSITVGDMGAGISPETAYHSLVADAFRRAGLEVEIIISALHGVYASYALRRFNRMVLCHNPDYVLIFLGSNDAGSTKMRATITPEDYRIGLHSLAELCLKHNIAPILVGPPRIDIDCQFSMKLYFEASRKVSQDLVIPFVDLFVKFSNVECLSQYFPDGLHPNLEGSQIIAESLGQILIPYLLVNV